MVSILRGGCRSPFMAIVVALGLSILCGSSAMAQGGGGGGMGGGGLGGMGGGGFGGMSSMTGSMNGMGGMGHMGAFGMSGVTAGGLGGVGPTSGMGRMSGMGTGYGYGYGQSSGYGYAGTGYGGSNLSYYGSGPGLDYGGFGMGYTGFGPGYEYGGVGYNSYGSAPGNYYYPYSNPIYLNSSPGFVYTSAYVAPATNAANMRVNQGRYLGIDEEPVVDASGRKGMKVAKVYPETAAERAGLRPGDVIHSINGFFTQRRGNLAWIIANAAYNNVLNIQVHTVHDGLEHTLTAQLPPVSP